MVNSCPNICQHTHNAVLTLFRRRCDVMMLKCHSNEFDVVKNPLMQHNDIRKDLFYFLIKHMPRIFVRIASVRRF